MPTLRNVARFTSCDQLLERVHGTPAYCSKYVPPTTIWAPLTVNAVISPKTAAGPGALLSEAQALLRSGGGATPMLRRADEPEPMAARPTDAAEPMARWEGDDTPDSWHL